MRVLGARWAPRRRGRDGRAGLQRRPRERQRLEEGHLQRPRREGERARAQARELRAAGARADRTRGDGAGTDRPQEGNYLVAQRAQHAPAATLVRHLVLELRRRERRRLRRAVGLVGQRRILELRGGGGERVQAVGRLLKPPHRVAQAGEHGGGRLRVAPDGLHVADVLLGEALGLGRLPQQPLALGRRGAASCSRAPHRVAHGLDRRAHDAEPDAPWQRLQPCERDPEVRHGGLQRAPAVLVHERVRRELRASLDQPLRLLGEVRLEDQLVVGTTHQRARVGQEGARVDGKPRDVALRLRRHAPWPVEHEPAHPKGRGRQPGQGRQRHRLCAWRASAARATEL